MITAAWRRFLEWTVSPGGVRTLLGWSGARSPKAGDMPDLATIRRLGVVRLDGMGDLIVTTPFLRELRRSAPKARIELVVRREWAPLVAACPHVDEVIPFDRPWNPRYRQQRELWSAWSWSRRELRRRRWEAVLLPQAHYSFFEARWIAWFCGAGIRMGRRDSAEGGIDSAWRFVDRVHESPARGHDAEACLDWLRALGGQVADTSLELHLPGTVRQEAARLLPGDGVGPLRVAMGLGASQVEKIWPIERFVEVARRLVGSGVKPVLVGGDDCVAPARQVVGALGEGVVDLTGRLALDLTAAVLGRCSMFVGNDSGPMHLAAAMGIPVVEIVGWAADIPEDVGGTPRRIGPWCAHRRIVQPPDSVPGGRVQVGRVTVDAVWEALTGLAWETIPGGIGPRRR